MEKKFNLQLPISLYIKLSNNRFWRVLYISLHYGKAWKVEEIFKNIKIWLGLLLKFWSKYHSRVQVFGFITY